MRSVVLAALCCGTFNGVVPGVGAAWTPSPVVALRSSYVDTAEHGRTVGVSTPPHTDVFADWDHTAIIENGSFAENPAGHATSLKPTAGTPDEVYPSAGIEDRKNDSFNSPSADWDQMYQSNHDGVALEALGNASMNEVVQQPSGPAIAGIAAGISGMISYAVFYILIVYLLARLINAEVEASALRLHTEAILGNQPTAGSPGPDTGGVSGAMSLAQLGAAANALGYQLLPDRMYVNLVEKASLVDQAGRQLPHSPSASPPHEQTSPPPYDNNLRPNATASPSLYPDVHQYFGIPPGYGTLEVIPNAPPASLDFYNP